jgi:hypothetical protein
MNTPVNPSNHLNVEQLLQLHTITKEVSKFCQKQLRGYLDTMALLFRPRRILGEAIEGGEKEAIGGTDRTLAELREIYKNVALRPFDLRPELSVPLESIATQMQLYEWEYQHDMKTDRGWQSIKVTKPLTWVIAYASPYSLSMVRQVLVGKEQRDAEAVKAFVLRACVLHLQFLKLPAIAGLFEGLRYRVEVRQSQEMGELPLVTVSAPIATLRPPDNLVNIAAGLAGGASFAEVLDLGSVKNLQDPFRQEIASILKSHGQEL